MSHTQGRQQPQQTSGHFVTLTTPARSNQVKYVGGLGELEQQQDTAIINTGQHVIPPQHLREQEHHTTTTEAGISCDSQSTRHRNQLEATRGDSIAQRVAARSMQCNQPTTLQQQHHNLTGNSDNAIDDSILHQQTLENLPNTYCSARLSQRNVHVPTHSLRQMDKVCQYCCALLFSSEISSNSSSICCQKGKVTLTEITVPTCLRELIENNDAMTKNYLEHITQFNSAFAFASVTVHMANLAN